MSIAHSMPVHILL